MKSTKQSEETSPQTQHTSEKSANANKKVSFDQNGEGNAPKYGQAGDVPNESGRRKDRGFDRDKRKK